MIVVMPSDGVTIVSELSLCGIFLHVVFQLGSREKDAEAKCGFAHWGLEHGAGMAVTCQWKHSKLGGKILEL